jgi:hypothetical protein
MKLLAITLLAQLAAPAHRVFPVLSFPERGLDDPAAYRGYQTRFFRDAAGNTLQVYLDGREGRVVHLLADAEDESIAFTARDAAGRAAPLEWAAGAAVSRAGRARVFEHRLVAASPAITVGWFLLGSMRVERDFQYTKRGRAAFGRPFVPAELDRLPEVLGRLPPAERRRHLALLGIPDLASLRARLQPVVSAGPPGTGLVTRVVQPSLDGRDTMTLELRIDPRLVESAQAGDSLSLRARSGSRVPFTVRLSTTGRPLSPLSRREIFTPGFLRFLADARSPGRSAARDARAADSLSLRARWLEREVRGMELLASREKLMAGLPAYATYFGRDMLVTALMMRPVWRVGMSEFVVASVLRKLGPAGDVSHEEALGGQAVREAAAEYAALIDAHLAAARDGRQAAADSLLARARAVLGDARRVRENYHMIDDELQLPVLVGRWIADPRRSDAGKRAFLLDSSDGGGPRVLRLLRELALVARMTDPYARDARPENLVSFPMRDSAHWASASWRDSETGYAGGRYAMDVNAIWAPHALEATARILDVLRRLGLPAESLTARLPEAASDSPLGRYVRDPDALRRAVDTWYGASSHFVVRLGPDDVRARVGARLAAMPEVERRHWTDRLAASGADRDSLVFLALSLDAGGRPVGVANTDPATRLFLGAREDVRGVGAAGRAPVSLDDVRLFVRPYPVGLLVDRVGPVVANDAYAPPSVWRDLERDPYHGPRVVWGREVNLFLLGVAGRLTAGAEGRERDELRSALRQVSSAVRASGFRGELWSYQFKDGAAPPVATRYGTGSDVQLWSISDLAVQFALAQLQW